MTILEKYEQYKRIFETYFVAQEKDPSIQGAWIPAEQVVFDGSGTATKAYIGDGTVNLAHLLIYLILSRDNDSIGCCIETLFRLVKGAKESYKMIYRGPIGVDEPGFFIRDDISCPGIWKVGSVHSAWSGSIEGTDEDPCFSPFVSQDQIWNLLPPLAHIAFEGESRLSNEALDFIDNVLSYVIDNGHTLYDPYASWLLHQWTYIPTFNEDKVKPWERVQDREKHFKYSVKVKRGANNWYFAYGFRKTFENLTGSRCNKFKNFLYSLVYYPLIFVADRIYYPLFERWVGRKDTSYYNLAWTSGVWYFGTDFWKRAVEKFNKEGSHWDLIPLMVEENQSRREDVDLKHLKGILESYPEPNTSGCTMDSPIKYLILYRLWVICSE